MRGYAAALVRDWERTLAAVRGHPGMNALLTIRPQTNFPARDEIVAHSDDTLTVRFGADSITVGMILAAPGPGRERVFTDERGARTFAFWELHSIEDASDPVNTSMNTSTTRSENGWLTEAA